MINVPSQATSQSQPSRMTSHNNLEKLCVCVCVCEYMSLESYFKIKPSIIHIYLFNTYITFESDLNEMTMLSLFISMTQMALHNHRPSVVETFDLFSSLLSIKAVAVVGFVCCLTYKKLFQSGKFFDI